MTNRSDNRIRADMFTEMDVTENYEIWKSVTFVGTLLTITDAIDAIGATLTNVQKLLEEHNGLLVRISESIDRIADGVAEE